MTINASTKDGVNVSYAGAITNLNQSPLNSHCILHFQAERGQRPINNKLIVPEPFPTAYALLLVTWYEDNNTKIVNIHTLSTKIS